MTVANMVDSNMSVAIAQQGPPPPLPLDPASVRQGATHLRMAVVAEGFSGGMIYSQNCYDALGREFTWRRLDLCGGFDALASRAIDDADTSTLAIETVYFQSEAVAGRYLAAATGAGQPAEQADLRLNSLVRRVAAERVPRAIAAAPAAEEEMEDAAPDAANSIEESAVVLEEM